MTSRDSEPPNGLVGLLSKAFELSTDGFALVNSDHSIVRVNRAWMEIHGFERSEAPDVIGLPLSSFHNEGQRERELTPLLGRLTSVGGAQGLLGHVKCDGDVFQTWTTFAAVEGDECARYVVMIRDLSAEPTAANALRRTGGFLHSVVENIPDMVFVKDAEQLRFVLVNRAGEELLGLSRTQLVGKSDADLFPAEEARARAAADRAALEGAVVVDIPEELVETRLHGKRWLHTKKIPIRDANGTPRYLLGLSEDITDRKAYSEAAENLRIARAAVASRDEFLAFASHELRSPIGAALLESETVLHYESDGLSERVIRRFKFIHRAMLRMREQVNELLDASKIAAGRLDLHLETTDLSALVRQTADGFSDERARHGSELVLHADGAITGHWDAMRLEEVVTNLLSNAFKYGNRNPVHVTVSAEPGGISRLTVRDHGIGMADAEQGHIFERFVRAKSSRRYSGFGLGLWIVRQIVVAHGGAISVSSALGEGSTFIVDLPGSD